MIKNFFSAKPDEVTTTRLTLGSVAAVRNTFNVPSTAGLITDCSCYCYM